MITFKVTFGVQFDRTPEITTREEPRQTFFDWYEPEEAPPVEVTEDRRPTVLDNLRQLFFSWCEE